MKNRVIKLILCIAIVSSLMVGFCTSFASAEPAWLIRAKAGIAAAMLASQLVINPVNYALDDALAEGIDPAGYVQSIGETPWEMYLEQSVIKVLPDVVTIDGVPYSDIWLGPEAAESLRLAGLDFASAYNIVNNQSSALTYASGTGYILDIPAYNINGVIRTPSFTYSGDGNYSLGSSNVNVYFNPNNYYRPRYTVSDSSLTADLTFNGTYGCDAPSSGYIYYSFDPVRQRNNFTCYTSYTSDDGVKYPQGTLANQSDAYVADPFSFDYTSGIIDAPLDPEDGLLLRVPTTYSDPESPSTVIYDIHDLVNIYPTVTQPGGHEIEIDPNLNPDFQTDIDLGNGIGDIIRTILTILDILDNIEIEFAPEPESPEPGPVDPDPAEPNTPLSEQDGTWLDELLRWIKHAIDVLHQDLENVLNSIDTQFTEIYHEIEQIFDAIKDWATQLPDVIKRAHAKGMKDALGSIKKIILPLLAPIKAFLGLWHYVVEWVAATSTPFTWIFGIMSATSYNLVLPIYASLAGVICIAIYKSFGR